MNTDIESLIAPLLRKVCEYCVFKKSGYEVPQEVVLAEIRTELSAISQQCASIPTLQQQYSVIEKPLVFFIDYTIKEGNFSYSRSYREIARNFNELSGDEKFFDLLSENLKRKDDADITKLFYTMIGLGFDGTYKRHRADILDIMDSCAKSFTKLPNINKERITPEVSFIRNTGENDKGTHKFYRRQKVILFGLVLFAILSWGVNWLAFHNATEDFVDAVEDTAQTSMNVTANSFDINGADDDSASSEKDYEEDVPYEGSNALGAD